MDTERGNVYVVDRGSPKLRAGQGLAAGLGVVLRHFRDAFGKKLDSPEQTSGVFTVQYPEERLPLPEAYRNFPILLFDDTSKQELCTSCFQCQRICPPQVIHMTQAKDPTTGKAVPAVAEFLIEYDACMSCGLCAEVCPFDAIKMDHEFELATDVHNGLTLNKEQLNRPISYYEHLAPGFWAEARDSALKKLEGNAKRRPAGIGLAEQVAINEPIAAPMPVITNEPIAAPVLSAEASPATSAPLSPSDKAAKLAAIRAANAAKQAASADSPPAPVPSAPVPSAPPAVSAPPPADDKAARLAAIRAANAAKQAASADSPPAPVPSAPVPSAPPPADDKAARLAAIRAANAAKQAASAESPPAPVSSAPPAVSAPPPADDKAARLAAIRAANAAKRAAGAEPAPPSDSPPANDHLPSDPSSERENQP